MHPRKHEMSSLHRPSAQEKIRAKCLHPSGMFVEFPIEDVETSIPARFEKIVRQYPHNIAIKVDERFVTYAELNEIANRVSRVVVARGGNGAVPVALLLEKGVEQIAAMIGVLKAGRSFVLVDSSVPKARFEVIVEDCSPDLAITDRQNVSLAKELIRENQSVIEIDAIDDNTPSDNLCREIFAETLAFIVHTSGSTGRPKGVINNHRMVLHHLMLRSNADRFCPQDRIPLLTSGTSHAIIASFGALLNGATLLPVDVNKTGVAALSRWLVQEKITILPIAAPLFRKLCEFLTDADRFPEIRLLRLSSETVCKTDVDLYKRYFSDYGLLVNGVNSSETHLLAEYIIDKDTQVSGDDVPVGYAVRDKDILLLDEQGDSVGYNEIGEIVVRSEYLSPGYWRNPELTAAKFKPDPIDARKRLYYSGDLGLMLPDGCLIHKGRKDFRVKIRGYRVELGEVERALQCHPAIQHAVVIGREDRSSENRLIAYYTSSKIQAHSVSEFRTFIREKLPEYMVPSAFIRLDSLPLTSNGKIDRQALPDPDRRRPELDARFIAPRSDLERTVAQIFSECTGIEQVGIDDNFLDLGGDSLLLGRLVSRLSSTFQRELSMSELVECPTIAGIARLMDEPLLSPAPKVDVIRRATTSNRPDVLSFAQKRLWFLDQLNPGDPAYNLLLAFQIDGELNLTTLEQSVNEIIARHEVLRTVFDAVDGEPCARVLRSSTIALDVADLGKNKSAIEDEAVLQRHCAVFAQKPFDLRRGPMLRVSLLRRSEGDYVLLLAVHHIVFDGWSVGVLWNELSACYEALSRGSHISLPPLTVQYADYARWQTEWLQNQGLHEQVDYWRQQLAGRVPVQLLTDRPRPPIQTSRGAKQYFTLSLGLSAQLKRLGRDCGATLFMTLMAAFQTLLHRYTGQDDIAVGCPVAGRNRPELDDLIGLFLNTLVLRVDAAGDPSFRDFLDRVRQVCLAGYAHQYLPFEKLVEEIQPERHLNRNPIVDVVFAFQNTPYVAPKLGGTSVSQLDVDSGISRFDLQLFMEETSGQLRGNFSYNMDLFDAPTMDRMAKHFVTLLEGIAAHPDQPIGQLNLLSPPERKRLLDEWNDTARDYPSEKCIHELFEAQVEKTPDAIALVFEDRQLSYREVNNRANQLGHYLRKRRVGPEVPVGICVERSPEMVIGLLGILKAGGAYVPLDPNYPATRLDFMLADAHVGVLLTQKALLKDAESRMDDGDRRSSNPDRHMARICLDADWEEIARESDANPEIAVTPDNLAYVVYTSGSTGQVKGVSIEHRNTAAFLAWVHCVFAREELCGVLAATSISFDLSIFEIFAPLTCGGTVVIAENALSLATIPEPSRVCLINTVPSAMHELLRLDAIPSSVRVINLAGEPLPPRLVRRIYEATSARKVHDLYGPSECTTYSTWTCRTPDGPHTLGRPIGNTQIYILDRQLQPVPIGVAGEIYIGGAGLARGYLNQPELTAQKFIYHSFNGEPGRRLYKTGDLARYLADGNIEFLGRIDKQVKLRGYRIELGEIETVLGQHPMVQNSVVVVREDTPRDKRLIGYVVERKRDSLEVGEIKRYLTQKLPAYMVPSKIVQLDDLPRTPNGKIDRAALPVPDQHGLELDDVYEGPRTAREVALANIWADVLRVDKIGIRDNFFELGGHSLLASQIISRTRNYLSIELPLRALFEAPTVAELAALIERRQAGRSEDGALAQTLREVEFMSEEESKNLLGT